MNQDEIKKEVNRTVERLELLNFRHGFVRGFWIGSILTAIGIVLTAWLIHKI